MCRMDLWISLWMGKIPSNLPKIGGQWPTDWEVQIRMLVFSFLYLCRALLSLSHLNLSQDRFLHELPINAYPSSGWLNIRGTFSCLWDLVLTSLTLRCLKLKQNCVISSLDPTGDEYTHLQSCCVSSTLLLSSLNWPVSTHFSFTCLPGALFIWSFSSSSLLHP